MAGAPFSSNVLEGARIAAALEPDVVVFDGSGAAIPPIATSARVLVAHDLSGLNRYRALVSDLLMTMSDGIAEREGALPPRQGGGREHALHRLPLRHRPHRARRPRAARARAEGTPMRTPMRVQP